MLHRLMVCSTIMFCTITPTHDLCATEIQPLTLCGKFALCRAQSVHCAYSSVVPASLAFSHLDVDKTEVKCASNTLVALTITFKKRGSCQGNISRHNVFLGPFKFLGPPPDFDKDLCAGQKTTLYMPVTTFKHPWSVWRSTRQPRRTLGYHLSQ